jgi:hypothetical protein
MIKRIQQAIKKGNYRITRHADEEMVEDSLELEEVEMSLRSGDMIESYPDDLPLPSCLVYGENDREEPIHSVWAYDEDESLAILITVYRPDRGRWIDFKKRRC